MRAFAVIVLAPAFALGAVAGAAGIVGGPTKQTQRPDSLVWANRVFPTRQSFETWLGARGASYTTWAQRHPSAAVVFDTHDQPLLSAGPAESASTHRTKDQALIVALVAGASLVLLFTLYGLRSRHPRLRAPRPPGRLARPLLLPHARLHPLTRAASAGPLLATSAAAVVRRESTLVVTVHHGLTVRRLRRLAPTITFYAIAVVLAVVIGASVAIYLQ